METKSFDFWQDHSVHFLEMALGSDKRERITTPSGYGKQTNGCGDTVEIFLVVAEGCICHAAFESDGCLYTVACANTVVHLAEGRTLENARQINTGQVIDFLETLPAEEKHCAELAVSALESALKRASAGSL